MSKRKFFKQKVTIEILSEDKPLSEDVSLEGIYYAITDGDCSGIVTHEAPEELNGEQAAKALMEQKSDPSFFRLTEDGEDAEDE